MNLAEIYVGYTNSLKESKERDPLRLFVSDVGKCKRQVAYRLLQTEKDKHADEGKEMMFDLAEYIELTLSNALSAKHMLIGYQVDVEIRDRHNWGGRCDILADYGGGLRVIEVKTLYPAAFRHKIWYPQHRYQSVIYDEYLKDIYGLTEWPLLWYADRGGQNDPVEQEVNEYFAPASIRMDELDAMRDTLPDIPDRLPNVLKLRSYKKKIVYEPDWNCGRCDYVLTCGQNMSKSVWAERKSVNDQWELKTDVIGDYELLGEFIDSIISEQMGSADD